MISRPVVLASASPRRRELLGKLIDEFDVVATDSDESFDPAWIPAAIAEDLACRKAVAGSLLHPDSIVIAADTIVVLDSVVLNKPFDRAHARQMLSSLAGRDHLVYTGIAVRHPELAELDSISNESSVRFRALEVAEIEAYLDSDIWSDKAGAYGIQGTGGDIVESVIGCFQNVVGFPLCIVGRMLERAGVPTRQKSVPCGLRSAAICPDWPGLSAG